MSDVDTFLMQTGTPSFKFEKHGDTAKGEIVSAELQQQRDINTNAPVFWEDGKPKMQARVVLATDQRSPDVDDDEGHRSIYIRGEMQKAVRDAVIKAGANKLEVGGTLAVQYFGDGEKKKAAHNPPKLYKAQYAPPQPQTGGVTTDDLL